MKSYDVVVIGSGTAGQTLAYELNARGLNVAVAEKSDRPGGTCAISGCQAKKWFYEGAEIIAKSHHLRDRGIRRAPRAEWADLMAAKNAFTTAVPAVLFTYPQYGMVGVTEQSLRDRGVPYVKSTGKNLRWPTYRRIGMTHAAYKILAGTDGHFLGAHVLSDNAAGPIHTIRLAMLNRITADALYRQCVMSPYPSRESDLIYMLKPLAGN